MRHVIGIDQGGSGTRAVIAALDGSLLGWGSGPGACHPYDGMDKAMEATQLAAASAAEAAGVVLGTADILLGGYTGADWPDEYGLLQEAVRRLDLAAAVYIVNDSIAALRGGTDRPYGAILVAGTGANCAVRAPDGREYIYHYYHDDELQGGSAIGTAALKAIFRAETGRPPQTSLREQVLSLFQLPDVDALKRGFVEGVIPSRRVPDIAPLVFAEAARGDQAARTILIQFGEGGAELLVNGLRRLGMLDLEVEVVLSGGIFKAGDSLLRQALAAKLSRQAPRARLVQARFEPVVGAALLALEKVPVTLTSETKGRIERSAQRLGLLRY